MSTLLPGDHASHNGTQQPRSDAPSPRIDPAWSINDVLLKYPATITVFNAYGVDACCGGAQSVADAAAQDGIDLAALLAALEGAVGGAA